MADFWGAQTSRGGRTQTRSRYTGGGGGYMPPAREDRPDIIGKAREQEQALAPRWEPSPAPSAPTQGVSSSPLGRLLRTADTLRGMRQDFYGQSIGSNPRFSELVPAQEILLGQPLSARGWDQYAALAGAGANPSAQSAESKYALATAPVPFMAGGNPEAARMYPSMRRG
jgi:hypothetical protein